MRSKKIRNAARGQECTLCILGVCNEQTETVVSCHLPDETKGMSLKADDMSIAFGCSACHQVIDGLKCEEFEVRSDWYLRRAQRRTLSKLFELGIIKIA